VTTETMFTILALGGVGGWFVGRWWAEDARAKYDQQLIWDRRRNYRKKKPDSS
jgi:hypothetical protein